jgi:hypothetical protein
MRHAFKNGIFNDRRIPVGSEQGSSKLTEDQVLEIRKRLINGESCTLISKDYNVVPQTIGKIKLNQRWKHVTI